MDTVYPEPMSRLHRRAVRKQNNRAASGRYRTQPITFQEIKEVDEENLDEQPSCEPTAAAASKSELDLNLKFEEFWRLGREKAKEKKKKREIMKDDDNLLSADVILPTDLRPTSPQNDALHILVAMPSRNNANPRTSI